MIGKESAYRAVGAASLIPCSVLRRLAGEDPLIPVYHTVSDEDLIHVKHLYHYKSVDRFVADVDFLIAHHSPINMGELLEARRQHQVLPANALLLTFDDGMREVYDVIAPILKEKGVPATFFLTTAFLDNQQLFFKHKASILTEHLRNRAGASELQEVNALLSKYKNPIQDFKSNLVSVSYDDRAVLDEIAALLKIDFFDYLRDVQPYLTTQQVTQLIEQGFTIGAHSVDHPMYSSLALSDQVGQTVQGMHFLCEKFSIDYKVFAFPFNDRGVRQEFFEQITSDGEIDLVFGTSSMMRDTAPALYQRTIMETLPVAAPSMLVARYIRKLIRCSIGRNQIQRC